MLVDVETKCADCNKPGTIVAIPLGFSNSDLAWAIAFSLLLGFMIGFMGAFYVL